MIFSPKWTLDFLPSVPQPPVSHSSVHGLNIHSTFTHSIPSAGTSISPFNVYQAAITFPPCSQSLSCTPTNVSIFYCFFLFFFLAVVSSTQRWFETSTSPVTHAKVQECWISLSWSSLASTLFPITHSTLVPMTTLLSLHHVAGIPNSGCAQPLPSLTRKPSADFDQAHSSVTSKYLSSGGASPTSSSWISYLFSSHFLLPSFFFIMYLPQHDLMYLLFKSPSWNISSTKVEK